MFTGERWRSGGDLRIAATRVGVVGLWAFAVTMVVFTAATYAADGGFGMDGHAYWLAGRVAHPYALGGPDKGHGFLYSPLFAEAMRPLAVLPWPVFYSGIIVVESCAYAWLIWPLPARWRALCFTLCIPALMIGNIYGLLGVALVLASRRPGFWAVPLLTKVAPSGVGFLWHAVRGEWSALVRAGIATLALVGASAAFEPNLWVEWLQFLEDHSGDGVWRLVQIPLAFAVAVYAARSDHRWALVIAWWLAMPTAPPWFMQGWVALLPLVRLSAASQPHAAPRVTDHEPRVPAV